MKELKTEILINATPEKVWKILTDFSSYPEWNPFIKSIHGMVAVNNRISVLLEPPGVKGMTIKPTVVVFEKEKELRWLGHLLFTGLFDGEHKFELNDNKDGTTTFVHSEKFGGILVPLFNKMLDVNTRKGFEEMNLKLKELAESGG